MNHEEIKELIFIYALNEITDDEKEKVKEHIKECKECEQLLYNYLKLNEAIISNKPDELDDIILQKTRLELLNKLDNLNSKSSIFDNLKRFIENIFVKNYKLSLGFSFTLIIGFIIGYFYNNNNISKELINSKNLKIDNVTFLNANLETNEIELGYTLSKEVYYKGKFDDETTKNLLAIAIYKSNNSGLKLTGINFINSIKEKEYISDKKIKDALIKAAKADKNAGVRMQAVNTLNKFIPDEEIIEVYLYILSNDENAALRIEAINRLTEIKANGYKMNDNAKDIISQSAENDNNKLVQIRAAKLLDEEI